VNEGIEIIDNALKPVKLIAFWGEVMGGHDGRSHTAWSI
jgi:hypothetical protein